MRRLVLLLIIPFIILAQIEVNPLNEIRLLDQKYNFNKSYIKNTQDDLTVRALADTGKYIRIGMEGSLNIQNSSINSSWNYNDPFHFSLSPLIYGKVNPHISFYARATIQNEKSDLIDMNKPYYGDVSLGMWGDLEIAKIKYDSKHVSITFGRDYFMPGLNFYESTVFSKYQYPYDQIKVAYHNRLFNLTSYYLSLGNMMQSGTVYARHLNGHRLSFDLWGSGHIAVNEIMLYGGENRAMNPALFNPFLIYYLYQRNKDFASTNSMISLDLFYHLKDYFLSIEFMLDDFMKDKAIYADLEPNKLALNMTIGKKDIIKGLNWDLNYTAIANRVYSTLSDNIFYERFIYQNLPTGHYCGSNLWEIKSTLSYLRPKYKAELKFIYREQGDDVLYSPYNTDHFQGHEWNDPLEANAEWNEAFPYVSDGSDPTVFWGFQTNQYYQFMKHVGLNIKAAYWVEKGFLENHFNVAGGLFLNF
jgi:hypothetical protein